jgi:hypothetical protein
MKPAFLAVALAALAVPASAEVSGPWRVTGKVSGFAFTLTCDFKTAGDRLGGVCTDTSTSDARVKAGKSHVITAGSVHGDAVTWTYQSSFLFSKFDVTYKGTLAGNRMTGTIDAQGHTGAFTAVKP